MGNVDDKKDTVDDMRARIERKRKEASEQFATLQELLKSGQIRSDNPVKDFCTVYLRRWDEDTLQPYRELEEDLKDKEGQLVLIVTEARTKEDLLQPHYLAPSPDEVKRIMAPPEYYKVSQVLHLGRLGSTSGLTLDIQKEQIVINTKNHTSSEHKYFDMVGNPDFTDVRWKEKICGPIRKDLVDLPHLYPNLGVMDFALAGLCSGSSKVLVGVKVEEYFASGSRGTEAYAKALALFD